MSLTGVPSATMGFASGNKTPSVRPVLVLIMPAPQRGSVSHLELPCHQRVGTWWSKERGGRRTRKVGDSSGVATCFV
jgi:hypothetical protein